MCAFNQDIYCNCMFSICQIANSASTHNTLALLVFNLNTASRLSSRAIDTHK